MQVRSLPVTKVLLSSYGLGDAVVIRYRSGSNPLLSAKTSEGSSVVERLVEDQRVGGSIPPLWAKSLPQLELSAIGA